MIIAITQAGESLFTESALKRLLPCVQAHMDFQIRLLNRSLGTVWAFVHLHLPPREMSLLKMSLQPLISCVAAPTCILQANEFALRGLIPPSEAPRHPVMLDHCRTRNGVKSLGLREVAVVVVEALLFLIAYNFHE